MLKMQEMAFTGSKIFWGSILPDPPIHARYVGHIIYYLTEKSLFKQCPPWENP
jgi:hypothetical protein